MVNDTNTSIKTFSIDNEREKFHKDKLRKRIKRFIIVIFIWILIIIYLLLPISKLNLKVSGNEYYNKEDLVNMAYINEEQFWWLINKEDIIKVLEADDFINNVEISKSPLGVAIKIEEIYPVGEKHDNYILSNGESIIKSEYPFRDRINHLTNFNKIDNNELFNLVNRYSLINKEIRDNFYDIEIVSGSNDYKYVKLYGYNDKVGYFIIKTDLVYLNTKFAENKYSQIIEKISKSNVKYEESNPVMVAYHYVDEDKFEIVDLFEEE